MSKKLVAWCRQGPGNEPGTKLLLIAPSSTATASADGSLNASDSHFSN